MVLYIFAILLLGIVGFEDGSRRIARLLNGISLHDLYKLEYIHTALSRHISVEHCQLDRIQWHR